MLWLRGGSVGISLAGPAGFDGWHRFQRGQKYAVWHGRKRLDTSAHELTFLGRAEQFYRPLFELVEHVVL